MNQSAAMTQPASPSPWTAVLAGRLASGAGLLSRAWRWVQSRQLAQSSRRLKVAETVSLGEKRFVALIVVDGRQFLVGGGAGNVALLAQLNAGGDTSRDEPAQAGEQY